MQAIEGNQTAHGGSISDANAAHGPRDTARRSARFCGLALLTLLIALVAAGCGEERGDAEVKSGNFKVKVAWKFAKTQPLGKSQNFTLLIRNVDTQDIPQLVVTIKGLRQFIKQEGAASDTRPIWVPNEDNYANVTPNSTSTGSTFDLGMLAAGDQERYVLPLTPVRRGTHEIGYVLAGNIYGTATVELEDGNPAASARTIAIDPTPVFNERVFD